MWKEHPLHWLSLVRLCRSKRHSVVCRIVWRERNLAVSLRGILTRSTRPTPPQTGYTWTVPCDTPPCETLHQMSLRRLELRRSTDEKTTLLTPCPKLRSPPHPLTTPCTALPPNCSTFGISPSSRTVLRPIGCSTVVPWRRRHRYRRGNTRCWSWRIPIGWCRRTAQRKYLPCPRFVTVREITWLANISYLLQ